MKRRQRIRTVWTWVALASFVLTTLLSGMHRHPAADPVVASCFDCTHHVHHSGHLSNSADNAHDCVLCQFLYLFYSLSATILAGALVFAIRAIRVRSHYACCGTVGRHWPSRAPPAAVR